MKKVLEFAAKEIPVGDSQASWQKWNAEQQQQQAGNENKADEQQFTKKIQYAKWSRQVDSATGQPYWIDSVSGNVTRMEPNFVETVAEEEEEEAEKPTSIVQYETPQAAAAQPPQVWEVMLNSLTRKPMWYCEQMQITLHKAPPPAPWRVVREENGQVYFWNPETGETRD